MADTPAEPWKDYQEPAAPKAEDGPWSAYQSTIPRPTQAAPAAPLPLPGKSSTLRRVVGDSAIDVGKGIVDLGQAAVGVADLATGGYAGKGLESIGYDPTATNAALSEHYTPERQAANKVVNDAHGFLPTVKAMLQNPSTIAGSVLESAPSTLGGGAGLARGIAGKAIPLIGKIAPMVAAGIGEGAIQAGQSAEQSRATSEDKLLSAKGAVGAVASGAIDALISTFGGATAQKLGIADIDTLLAGGKTIAKDGKKGVLGALKRALEGVVQEGVLEELPQSAQEQMWQNYATNQPLMAGVPEAAAQGAITGAVQGGATSAVVGGDPAEAKKKDEANPEAAGTEAAPATPRATIAPDVVVGRAQSALDALNAKANGTADAQIRDETGELRTVRGTPAQVLTDAEKRNREWLTQNIANPAALADRLGMDLEAPPVVSQPVDTNGVVSQQPPVDETQAQGFQAPAQGYQQPSFGYQAPTFAPAGPLARVAQKAAEVFPGAEPGSLAAAANTLAPTAMAPAHVDQATGEYVPPTDEEVKQGIQAGLDQQMASGGINRSALRSAFGHVPTRRFNTLFDQAIAERKQGITSAPLAEASNVNEPARGTLAAVADSALSGMRDSSPLADSADQSGPEVLPASPEGDSQAAAPAGDLAGEAHPVSHDAAAPRAEGVKSGFSIEGVDDIVRNGSGRVRVFNNGNEVGFKTFAVSIDGDTASVGFVHRDDNAAENRGAGIEAYRQLGDQLAAHGIRLESSGTLQAQGRNLWERLANEGRAKRTRSGFEYLPQSATKEQATPATAFQNVIHDKPAMQVGSPREGAHVSEDGYTYRTMSQAELDDARANGSFRAPNGKAKGGRTNVKHWVRGGTGQFFNPGAGGGVLVRVKNRDISQHNEVPFASAEVRDEQTGSFAPAGAQAGLSYDTSDQLQEADHTPPSGEPFTHQRAAELAAGRVEGGKVFPVEGGFVVRVPQTSTQAAPTLPAESAQAHQAQSTSEASASTVAQEATAGQPTSHAEASQSPAGDQTVGQPSATPAVAGEGGTRQQDQSTHVAANHPDTSGAPTSQAEPAAAPQPAGQESASQPHSQPAPAAAEATPSKAESQVSSPSAESATAPAGDQVPAAKPRSVAEARAQAKDVVANLSDETIADFAKKNVMTDKQARKHLTSEAHWSPDRIIKDFGPLAVAKTAPTANQPSTAQESPSPVPAAPTQAGTPSASTKGPAVPVTGESAPASGGEAATVKGDGSVKGVTTADHAAAVKQAKSVVEKRLGAMKGPALQKAVKDVLGVFGQKSAKSRSKDTAAILAAMDHNTHAPLSVVLGLGVDLAPSVRAALEAGSEGRITDKVQDDGTSKPTPKAEPSAANPKTEQQAEPTPQATAANKVSDQPTKKKSKAKVAALENVEPATPFYSALAKSIDEAKGAPKRASYGQWKGWLDGAVRRGEFKQSERDWLGLDDWIKSQGDVTKQQLADFVRENQVQVKDVTLGDDASDDENWSNAEAWWNDEGGANEETPFNELTMAEQNEAVQRYMDEVGEYAENSRNPKFASYQLPGGSNYRELLMTLPQAERVDARDVAKELGYGPSDPLPQSARDEIARRVDAANAKRDASFRSSHFDQPNILAHVRFNERTDADGKKVLFLEELQSDWHQQGRKRGYGKKWIVRYANAGLDSPLGVYATEAEAKAKADALNAESPYDNYGYDYKEEVGTPDAPFKGTDEWAMLAFKRMVHEAAVKGVDSIAWTTGEQQAARYDLSKTISRIEYSDTGRLTALDTNGKQVIGEFATEEKLPDIIGKEAAEKLLASKPIHHSGLSSITSRARVLEGANLKIGGEGMKGFYDQILPAAVNKWAKRFGGKVEQADLSTPGNDGYTITPATISGREEWRVWDAEDNVVARFPTKAEAKAEADRLGEAARANTNSLTVHSLKLTPAMREAALQGQPLFNTEQATELDKSQLTPAEREVMDKASNSSEAKQKAEALSKAQGEADAHERGFHKAIQKVLGDQADRVEYVRDYAGLPEELRSGVEARNAERNGKVMTAAIYDPVSKRVFLITSVVKTADRAVWNALHEIAGHDGLRKLLGTKLDPALTIALQNPTVKQLADAIMADRSMDKSQKLLAAEESLAELAAAVRTGNYDHIQNRYGIEVGQGIREQQSLKAAIANFLKRLQDLLNDLFGRPVFLDEDVRQLLDAAFQASQSDGTVSGDMAESAQPEQTHTAAFKTWFADSAVTNDDGSPRVVYHGTSSSFDTFDDKHLGKSTGSPSARQAFFFSASPTNADEFGALAARRIGGERSVMPAYLSIQNPLIHDVAESDDSFSEVIAQAKEDGNDGVIFLNANDSPDPPTLFVDGEPQDVDSRGTFLGDTLPAYLDGDGFSGDVQRELDEAVLQYQEQLDDAAPEDRESYEQEVRTWTFLRDAWKRNPDSFTIKRGAGPATVYAAFKPTQIKSATANNGNFDASKPSILENVEPIAKRAGEHSAVLENVEPLAERLGSAANNIRGIRLPAQYLMGDFMGRAGGLNWWHKTVGTQFNLAQRYPAFKRVFDSVQGFLDDVSHYASEAMELAPTLLPQLNGLADIKKQPVSAADTKAVAKALNEGTLVWKRDDNGVPVHANDDEQAGLVWTDEELKGRYSLNDKQIGLYREARAAIDKSLANLFIAQMVNYAGEDVAEKRKQALDMTNVQEVAKLLAGELRSQVRDLGETNAEIKGRIKEFESRGASDSDIVKELRAEMEKHYQRASSLQETAGWLDGQADRFAELKSQGYAPLSRFGRHSVYVTAGDEQIYFGLFDTAAEANKMARKMREGHKYATIEQGTMSQEAFKQFQGLTPESIELFGDMLGLDQTSDNPSDQAFQSYLKLAKNNRSALKRLIHRKGIAGYSEDVGRVVASFLVSNARLGSATIHNGETKRAINDIPKNQGELKDAALRLSEYTTNPQEEAHALRALNFAQYLGGSIAAALVNMTQSVTMTFPFLSQYGGAWKAAARMKDATRDALKRTTGDAALDAAIHRGVEDGTLAPQEIHQLMAQARGAATLHSGDGTKMGDAYAHSHNAMAKIGLAWGKVFSVAEAYNRRTAFIAAYRTAQEEGIRNPEVFARNTVHETQGVYSKANKPRWARGAIGGTVFTFKQFSISYVEMLHRMATRGGPEGKKAALLALAVMALMAGAGGLPGADDLDDLIDGIMQRLGYNFSTKQERQDFFAKILGQGGAQFAERGLSGLPGIPIDVAGRLGMGNLIPGTGLLMKKDDHTRDLTEILGPTGDLATRAGQAVNDVTEGNIGKAALTISPVAIRNLMQGVDMYTTGMYRDAKGRKVIDTNGYEALSKAIGYQPNSVARVQQASGEVQQMIAMNKMVEREIADQWAQGLFEQDDGKVQDARDQLIKWNERNPTNPIRIGMSQLRSRLRAMNMDKTDRLAKTAPSEIRASVSAALNNGD